MADLSTDQIKQLARAGRDRFAAYLNASLGPSASERLSRQERELFNLLNAYEDGQVTFDEVDDIRHNLFNIDIDSLVDSNLITYDNVSETFTVINNPGDINEDEVNDSTDRAALIYALNFTEESLNTLDDILRIAGDSDAINEFQVQQLARQRGLVEGTEQYADFMRKFYDELYAGDGDLETTTITIIKRSVRLYDAGIGRSNIDELDPYLRLAQVDIALNTIVNLHRFRNSDSFIVSVPDGATEEEIETAKDAKLEEYINVLITGNREQKRFLSQAVVRNKVPLTNVELTTDSIDELIDLTLTQENLVEFRMKEWAESIGLIDRDPSVNDPSDPFDQFMNKFYEEYYQDENSGISAQDAFFIFKIFRSLRTRPGFDLDMLDIYRDAIESGLPYDSIEAVFRIDNSDLISGFSETARTAKLEEYLTLLGEEDRDVRLQFQRAIQVGRIPITGQDLTIGNLDNFITNIKEEFGVAELSIRRMAQNQGLIDTESDVDQYDLFVNKFLSYHKDDGHSLQNVSNLVSLYNAGNFISYDQLDPYAEAMNNGAKAGTLVRLARFADSAAFDSEGPESKEDAVNRYLNILSNGDLREQRILATALSNGRLPIVSGELTRDSLDEVLVKLEADDGLERLRFEAFAKQRNLVDTLSDVDEFDLFVNQLLEWHNNLGLDVNDISRLVRIHDQGNFGFADLEIYAQAISEGVNPQQIIQLSQLEINVDFHIGLDRDGRLNYYLDILKGDNNEKKRILSSALNTGRLPIRNEQVTDANLTELLDSVEDEADLADIYIDRWATERNLINFTSSVNDDYDLFTTKLKNFFTETQDFRKLQTFLRLYDFSAGSLELDDLDLYSEALSNGLEFNDIIGIFNFEKDNKAEIDATGRDETIGLYLRELREGGQLTRRLLRSTFANDNIPLTGKERTIDNIQEAIELVEDDDLLADFHVRNWATRRGITEPSEDFDNFYAKFYTEYYEARSLSITNVQNLIQLYNPLSYELNDMDIYADALSSGVQFSLLARFNGFAFAHTLTASERERYLRILMGENGDDQRKFLRRAIETGAIPISGTSLF